MLCMKRVEAGTTEGDVPLEVQTTDVQPMHVVRGSLDAVVTRREATVTHTEGTSELCLQKAGGGPPIVVQIVGWGDLGGEEGFVGVCGRPDESGRSWFSG